MAGFSDVSSKSWYAAAVQWAVDRGITSGTSTGHFSPTGAVTRGQAITFLWRAAGSPKVSRPLPFTDVPKGKYYAEPIAWALSKGITSGTSATRFSPEQPCTRAQVVTFLWRLAGCPSTGKSTFSDVPSNAWYARAVAWAAGKKITSGTGGGRFSPSAACTRAQTLTFLKNSGLF